MTRPVNVQSNLGKLMWKESTLELVTRWWGRHGDAQKAEMESPAVALERAETRAQRVLDYCQLPAARHMKTPREWQVGFDPKASWDRLSIPLRHWGWDIARQRTEPTFTNISQTALEHEDKPLVVVADAPLERQLAHAKATLCPYELDIPHLAAIALARELYAAGSDRMGALPRPWVDELASPAFAQLVLGLPFSPLIFVVLPQLK
jgi:hypothetical protein